MPALENLRLGDLAHASFSRAFCNRPDESGGAVSNDPKKENFEPVLEAFLAWRPEHGPLESDPRLAEYIRSTPKGLDIVRRFQLMVTPHRIDGGDSTKTTNSILRHCFGLPPELTAHETEANGEQVKD